MESEPGGRVIKVEPELIGLSHPGDRRLLEVLQHIMKEEGQIGRPRNQAEEGIRL